MNQINLDVCNIEWRLIGKCNYNCQYCPEPRESNVILLRDRLLAMASRILERNYGAYHFTFLGGEPTLHPMLPDIVTHILASSVNSRISIATNGSREIDWYQRFIAGLPENHLRFVIYVHPSIADMKHILVLTSMLSEKGQIPHIKLISHSGDEEGGFIIGKALTRLRSKVPFSLEFEQSGATVNSSSGWLRQLEQEYQASSQILKAQESFDSLYINPEMGGRERAYGVIGSNYLRIEPDGSWYLGACAKNRGHMPLWHPQAVMPQPEILSCGCCDLSCGVPRFEDREKAENWLASKNKCARLAKWEKTAFQSELASAVLDELNKLQPLSDDNISPASLPDRDFVSDKFNTVCDIYYSLENDSSKDIFLRLIQCARLGDTGYAPIPSISQIYLPDSNGTVLFQGELVGNTLERMIPPGCHIHDITPIVESNASVLRWLASSREIVSLLAVGAPGIEILDTLRPVIFDFMPNMLIRLGGSEILTVPSWLKVNFPQYKIYFSLHPTLGILLEARSPLPPVTRHQQPMDQPGLTIVLYVKGNLQAAQQSLDLFLLQSGSEIELIILDDSQNKTIAAMLDSARQIAPRRIRIITMPWGSGRVEAGNMAIALAKGKYLFFANEGDLPDRDFVAKAFGSDTDADLVLCLRNNPASDTGGITDDWLSALELATADNGSVWIFGRDLLLRSRAKFDDFGQLDDIHLLLPALAQSKNIALCTDVVCLRAEKFVWTGNAFEHFIVFLEYLENFWSHHNISKNLPAYARIIAKAFADFLPVLQSQLKRARIDGTLEDLLTPERIRKFASCRVALCMALAAIANSRHYPDLPQELLAENIRGKQIDGAKVVCNAFNNADSPKTPLPKLSVILSTCNGAPYLRAILQDILAQNFADFELIIVDDASTDQSLKILHEYASSISRLRLYCMQNYAGVGACLNFGINKARGKYIILVANHESLQSGYFADAISSMDSTGADLVLFSSQCLNEAGEIASVSLLPDANLDTEGAIKAFLQDRLGHKPLTGIFSRDFINKYNIRFSDTFISPDEAFLFECISHAHLAGTSSRVVSRTVEKAGQESLSCWSALHSAYQLQAFLHRCIADNSDADPEQMLICRKRMQRHFEYNLLPAVAAFTAASGFAPMGLEEHMALSKADNFLAHVLIELSQNAVWPHLPLEYIAPSPLASMIIDAANGDALWRLAALPPSYIPLEFLIYGANPDEMPEFPDLIVRICDSNRLADLVSACTCSEIIFADNVDEVDISAITHACACLVNDPAVNCLIFADVESSQTFARIEIIEAWAKGLLGWNISGNKIYKKDFLLANENALGVASSLPLFAMADKIMVLPSFKDMESINGNSGLRNIARMLDIVIKSSQALGEQLETSPVSVQEKARIWGDFTLAAIRPLLSALKEIGPMAETLLTEKKLEAIAAMPDLLASIRHCRLIKTISPNFDSFIPLHIHNNLQVRLSIVLRHAELVNDLAGVLDQYNENWLEWLLLTGPSGDPGQILNLMEIARHRGNVSLFKRASTVDTDNFEIDLSMIAVGAYVLQVDGKDKSLLDQIYTAISRGVSGTMASLQEIKDLMLGAVS